MYTCVCVRVRTYVCVCVCVCACVYPERVALANSFGHSICRRRTLQLTFPPAATKLRMAANLPILAAIKMSKILPVSMCVCVCVHVFASARYVSVCSYARVFVCVSVEVCVCVFKCGGFELVCVCILCV